LARERVREAAGGAGALKAPPLEAGRRKALDEIIAGFRL